MTNAKKHGMLCQIRFLCLIASLFVMVSTVMAQGKMPDLMPAVVNANQGSIEVRNIGNAGAEPSQLFVSCSMFNSAMPSTPCAADLHLPGYIKKWNVLSYAIPALKPGARYRIHLFGSGALPRRPNNYGMAITVDPLKHIAESDELNNYTRLDTTIKVLPGMLRLIVQDDGERGIITFHYIITKHGDKHSIASGDSDISSKIISLVPGRYDLHVSRTHIFYAGFYGVRKYHSNAENIQQNLEGRVLGPEQEKVLADIHIQSGRTIEKRLVFNHIDAGFLKLSVKTDSKPEKIWLSIKPSGQGDALFDLSGGPIIFAEPLKVPLAPGNYRIHVEPQSGGYQGAGYGKKDFTVDIRPGKTLTRTVTFTSQRKGMLQLTVRVNGSRSKADVTVRKTGSHGEFPYSANVQTSYNLLSNKTVLLPGRYDISVWPLEPCFSPGGVDVFHGGVTVPHSRFRRIKAVEPIILRGIIIKSGETLEKTVKFKNNSQDVKVCL